MHVLSKLYYILWALNIWYVLLSMKINIKIVVIYYVAKVIEMYWVILLFYKIQVTCGRHKKDGVKCPKDVKKIRPMN